MESDKVASGEAIGKLKRSVKLIQDAAKVSKKIKKTTLLEK